MPHTRKNTSSSQSEAGGSSSVYGGEVVQKDPREIELEKNIQKWVDGEVDYDTVRRSVPDYYLHHRPSPTDRLIRSILDWFRPQSHS